MQNQPTRNNAIIDLIIVRKVKNIASVTTLSSFPSDHRTVVIGFESLRKIRLTAKIPVIRMNRAELSKIVEEYGQVTCQNVNEEAELLVKSVREMQKCSLKIVEKKYRADRPPWYSLELHILKMKLKSVDSGSETFKKLRTKYRNACRAQHKEFMKNRSILTLKASGNS